MIPRNVTVTVLKDDVAERALHRTQVLHSVRSSPDPAYSALPATTCAFINKSSC